ncbi:hypothetical protein INT47_008953 [Mucor saturninus]|uniref:Uncharacterized protein n=1 Tax=Mucor saturninus TaxID=64648 RepID=A0A8H7R4A9_9FUNG|nr:hypothetical protein INT47_008953 [Mucor saturninus]
MATLLLLLPKIYRMIETLQQELVDISASKVGVVWREKRRHPFNKTLDPNNAVKLMSPLTIEELIEQASRLTKQSSPGVGGLGYLYLVVLFQFSHARKVRQRSV